MRGTVIEGRNAVIEALIAGAPLRGVLLAEGVTGAPIEKIERLARERSVPVRRVGKRRLDELSERGAHQGVVAEADEYRYAGLETLLAAVGDDPRALVVALDNVTDPGNLGAIARSVEVAGGLGLLVAKRRSPTVGPAAYKTSAGALSHLPVVQEPNLVRALERLKDAGFWVAGAEAGAVQGLWEAPLDGRLVIVLGAEGSGLSRLTRETCDFLVSIPVAGKVGSLNVAQAATLMAYEWVRRGTGAGR